MGFTFGYARVSTQDQTLDLQKDALKAEGCTRIFTDTMSGAKADRPGLTAAFDHLRAGDTLVVWRLDRLGRTLKDLLEVVARFEREGIGFKSLREQIDTTTPAGTLVFHIFGSLAEFERALIRERTHAGLVAARARGRNGGRPQALRRKDPKLVEAVRQQYLEQRTPVGALCEVLGVSRSTFYRHVVGNHPVSRQA
jgi:DNA invertase Pin-like site-specific DNA recombinase